MEAFIIEAVDTKKPIEQKQRNVQFKIHESEMRRALHIRQGREYSQDLVDMCM